MRLVTQCSVVPEIRGSSLRLPERRESILTDVQKDQFKRRMETIAKTLADLDKTLPRDGIHRNRMALEDEYASVWNHFTRLNGEDAASVALTKQACRTQGCSEYFLEVAERFIKAGRQYPDATHNEAKVRFYAALRWAIHLSPDFGEEVFRRLDRKLDTIINRSCPLDFVNAYQAFKVRDAEK